MRKAIALVLLLAAGSAHALYKNIGGQRVCLYAWNSSTNAPQTGDAANITFYRSVDGGTVTSMGAPTEPSAANSPGTYCDTVATGDSNGDHITFTATSSTADVSLSPVQVYTKPWTNAGSVVATNNDKSGYVLNAQVHTGVTIPTVSTLSGHTAQTGDNYARLGAPNFGSISNDIADVKSTGGAGPWTTGGGGTGWTAAEQNQIRQALGVTGTTASTTGTGNLDTVNSRVDVDVSTRSSHAPTAIVNGGAINVSSGVAQADWRQVLGTTITESSTGRIASNSSNFWNNNNNATTKVVDDVGTATGGVDWTAAERNNIRFRLQMDGTQVAPSTDNGAQLPVEPTVWNGQAISTNLATTTDVWAEVIDGLPAGCHLVSTGAVQYGAYSQGVAGNDVTRTYRNQNNTADRVAATFNNATGTRTVATITCP